MPRILTVTALAIAFTTSVGCKGGGDADADTAAAEAGAGDTTSASADASGSPGASGSSASATNTPSDGPITVADVDAYERGLAAELAEVRKSADQMRSAKNTEDSTKAMFGSLDMQTQPVGAKAAGIPLDRYKHVSILLGNAISARKMNPALAKMGEDTSSLAQLPAEAREQARKNMAEMRAQNSDSVIYRDIPPELREQFKQRVATRLDTLWSELFALRARVAGLAK